jgi:hypothetical protein
MRTAWIPEAPEHRGLYANEFDTTGQSNGELQPSTLDALRAKQFPTRGECQAWCDAHPEPKFEPTEHGFD